MKNKVKSYTKKMFERQHHFSIRKLSVGVCSLAIGIFFLAPAVSVSADDFNSNSKVQVESSSTTDNNESDDTVNKSVSLEKEGEITSKSYQDNLSNNPSQSMDSFAEDSTASKKNDVPNTSMIENSNSDISSSDNHQSESPATISQSKPGNTASESMAVQPESEETNYKGNLPLTAETALKISKGLITLEDNIVDSLLLNRKPLVPDEDDDQDNLKNSQEIYTYIKNQKEYYAYNSHPLLKDTDGDGLTDDNDKNPLLWDVSPRDAVLFQELSYRDDAYIKKVLDDKQELTELYKNRNEYSLMHNELAPYWKQVESFHDKNGFDAVLFSNISRFPYLENNQVQVLAIRGTNEVKDVDDDIAISFGAKPGQVASVEQAIETLNVLNDGNGRPLLNNVYLTGHSLGGYLAQYANVYAHNRNYKWIKGAYTFNAPKIKGNLFNRELEEVAEKGNQLTKQGLAHHYVVDNDGLVSMVGSFDGAVSIGKTAGGHSSRSFLESNNNPTFNSGVRKNIADSGNSSPLLAQLSLKRQEVSPKLVAEDRTISPISDQSLSSMGHTLRVEPAEAVQDNELVIFGNYNIKTTSEDEKLVIAQFPNKETIVKGEMTFEPMGLKANSDGTLSGTYSAENDTRFGEYGKFVRYTDSNGNDNFKDNAGKGDGSTFSFKLKVIDVSSPSKPIEKYYGDDVTKEEVIAPVKDTLKLGNSGLDKDSSFTYEVKKLPDSTPIDEASTEKIVDVPVRVITKDGVYKDVIAKVRFTKNPKLTEAEELVAVAKAADKRVKNRLEEVNQDNFVTKSELEELTRFNNDVMTEKAKAEEAIKQLSDKITQKVKADLETVTGIIVPARNDRFRIIKKPVIEDNHIVLFGNTSIQTAEGNKLDIVTFETLEEAPIESGKFTFEPMGLLVNSDGSISGEYLAEHDGRFGNYTKYILYTDKKGTSNHVPGGQGDQTDFQVKLSIIGLSNPAKYLEKHYGDQVVENEVFDLVKGSLKLGNSGLTVDNFTYHLEDPLPESESVNTAEEKIKEVRVKVTTEDGVFKVVTTKIRFTKDPKLIEAENLVAKAEAAGQSASQKASDISQDGLITPSEVTELEAMNTEVRDAKLKAQEALARVADNLKGDLPARLAAVSEAKVPAVNDKNANSILDTDEDAAALARDLVAKAEAAGQSASQKASEISQDGLITPDEVTELEAMNAAVRDAKLKAQEAVERVADNLKGDLPARLAAVSEAKVPAVNDKNANDILDTDEDAAALARDLVAKAEAASQSASQKASDISQDGLITPSEVTELEAMNTEVRDAKLKAQEALARVADNLKGDLPARLAAVREAKVPAVNDKNANDILDTDEDAAALARDLVAKAEAAGQSASQKASDISQDGLITPSEVTELEAMNAAVREAKAEAEKALARVADNLKGDLPARLAAVSEAKVPAVNDKNANSILDTDKISKDGEHKQALPQTGSHNNSLGLYGYILLILMGLSCIYKNKRL